MNLSWSEAVQFTKWLSASTGHLYRLPTNSEWEYAARAGRGMNRFFDIPPPEVCKHGNVYDQTAHKEFEFEWKPMPCDDGQAVTAPVGQYLPNAFGLYDVIVKELLRGGPGSTGRILYRSPMGRACLARSTMTG